MATRYAQVREFDVWWDMQIKHAISQTTLAARTLLWQATGWPEELDPETQIGLAGLRWDFVNTQLLKLADLNRDALRQISATAKEALAKKALTHRLQARENARSIVERMPHLANDTATILSDKTTQEVREEMAKKAGPETLLGIIQSGKYADLVDKRITKRETMSELLTPVALARWPHLGKEERASVLAHGPPEMASAIVTRYRETMSPAERRAAWSTHVVLDGDFAGRILACVVTNQDGSADREATQNIAVDINKLVAKGLRTARGFILFYRNILIFLFAEPPFASQNRHI